MFVLKSLWQKNIDQSFKTTPEGQTVFFPGTRPKVFQGYIVKDEETKKSILEKSENNRKINNIFMAAMVLTSVTLIGVVGNVLPILIAIIGLIVSDYYWNKSMSKIVSVLEPYAGPDLWSPP